MSDQPKPLPEFEGKDGRSLGLFEAVGQVAPAYRL